MFKRVSKSNGFTLMELLVVIAVMSILAAVVVPNVTGFLRPSQDRAFKADKRIIQAAVDSWRTDVGSRSGNQWPTISGTPGAPPATVTAQNSTYVDIGVLATSGFLSDTNSVSSADTNKNTTATNVPRGSYGWYIDSNGRVQSSPAFTPGAYP